MSESEVTRLLLLAGESGPALTDKLFPLVYGELRQLAGRRLQNEPAGHTLNATALVNEAYVRLVVDPDIEWANLAHFYGAAGLAMRRILIERARKYRRLKRDRKRVEVTLDALSDGTGDGATALLILEKALERLESEDPEVSQVISLRYFAGLSVDDTAKALGTSTATIKRRWSYAKSWLAREVERIGELDD